MEKNAAIMILALAILIVVAAIVVVLLVQQPQNATVADSSNYPGNSSYSSSNPADSGSTPGASNPADSGSTPGAGGQPPGTPISNQSDAQAAPKAKKYLEKYPFYLFKDPNEGAFTINVPAGWQVSNESGLVRPYIDAAIALAAGSQNRGFGIMAPYAIYSIPTPLLDRLGFPEGAYYGGYEDIVKPMLVKKYATARQFIDEFMMQLDVQTKIVGIKDRPDLLSAGSDKLITKQSAAELAYTSLSGPNQVMNRLLVVTYLVGSESQGVWVANVFGYYSPESIFNETEYLVLKSAESLKVDADWAETEAQEMNKRLGIISATGESISETIASAFDYRSNAMDDITDEWSNAILGVEEVYNPDTGEMHIVDSGSNYYWIDNGGNIYGTDTYESPLPLEDLELMQCPGCDA